MKPTLCLPLVLCVLSFSREAPGALPVFAPGVSGVVPAATEDFMEEFRKAMRVGATNQMNDLVRKHQETAINKIVEICEFISTGSNEKLEEEIAALTKAWKAVYKTSFPDKIYEYFSLMRPEIKQHRAKLKGQYHFQNRKFIEAELAKDDTKFGELGMVMKGLGESFEKIGDYYYASQAYLHWGKAFDEFLRKDKADLKMAHDAFRKCVQTREKVDLKDRFYVQSMERQRHLEASGHGDPTKKVEVKVDPALEPVLLSSSFEVVEEIDAYLRPMYAGDAIFPMWMSLNMRDKGTSAVFGGIKEGSPKLLRTGSAKVMVDFDGDGEGDVEVPLTGRINPVVGSLGEGEEQRQWAFLSVIGGQKDNYNGIEFNLGPTDNFMNIYVAPAGSLVTEVDGTTLRVLDDNMDGVYGSDPVSWGLVGLVEEYFQKDMDTVVIGKSKVAVPWSEYLKIGEGWYRMQSEKGGNALSAARAPDVEVGTIKLSMKGLKADWLVVKGTEGSPYEKSYFEISASKKGVEVPAGRYELFAGQVSKGKKNQKAKALVLAARNTPMWTVEPDGTTTVELGSPFKFDFFAEQDEESVTVIGESISVTGAGNETYQRFWNCVPHPDASIRVAGKKRGSKGEGMKGPGSQQEVADKGFEYAWFPFTLRLDKRSKGTYETQLVEKKNKLFGKIESDWRE